MAYFENNKAKADELLVKAKEVAKGKSLSEADIDPKWMLAYGEIARRCRDDKDFGLSRHPYEQGPSVEAFSGGFFAHREWVLRKGLERHQSLRPVSEYGANYINAAGYWMSFHEAAIDLRQEYLAEKKEEEASLYDVWALIAARYGLRVTGMRAEFYKMAEKDPTYSKLVMPSLEQRNDVAAADDLVESMEKLDTHLSTQMFKEVATLHASNATKRAGKGSSARGQEPPSLLGARFGTLPSVELKHGANWVARSIYAGQSNLGYSRIQASPFLAVRGRS